MCACVCVCVLGIQIAGLEWWKGVTAVLVLQKCMCGMVVVPVEITELN